MKLKRICTIVTLILAGVIISTFISYLEVQAKRLMKPGLEVSSATVPAFPETQDYEFFRRAEGIIYKCGDLSDTGVCFQMLNEVYSYHYEGDFFEEYPNLSYWEGIWAQSYVLFEAHSNNTYEAYHAYDVRIWEN